MDKTFTEPSEILTVDEAGNLWKISMKKMETKTNRFQLSFFFNDKEFGLCKLQSHRSAQDTWELLERIDKAPKGQRSLTPNATKSTSKPTPKPKPKPPVKTTPKLEKKSRPTKRKSK